MHLYKVLFFLVPVFLLSACKPGPPAGVLAPKQMVPLLVDVHITDGSLADVPQIPDSLFKYGFNKYDAVFKQHKTDSTQFKKSFEWYANEPDQLYEIYVKVTEVLKAKNDSSLKARAKADSLEQVKNNKLIAARAKRFADSVKRAEKQKADSIRKKTKADTTVKKSIKPKIL